MSSWDEYIFNEEQAQDFLDELAAYDVDEDEDRIIEAVGDVLFELADAEHPSIDEEIIGQCAATICAIWCGAPYSAGDVVAEYPFIRHFVGDVEDEDLVKAAFDVLDAIAADSEYDLDAFVEACS